MDKIPESNHLEAEPQEIPIQVKSGIDAALVVQQPKNIRVVVKILFIVMVILGIGGVAAGFHEKNVFALMAGSICFVSAFFTFGLILGKFYAWMGIQIAWISILVIGIIQAIMFKSVMIVGTIAIVVLFLPFWIYILKPNVRVFSRKKVDLFNSSKFKAMICFLAFFSGIGFFCITFGTSRVLSGKAEFTRKESALIAKWEAENKISDANRVELRDGDPHHEVIRKMELIAMRMDAARERFKHRTQEIDRLRIATRNPQIFGGFIYIIGLCFFGGCFMILFISNGVQRD